MTSLVLGLLSVPTLLICGLGILLALAGLVVGIIALVQARSRASAAWAPPDAWPPPATGPGAPGRRGVIVMAVVGIAASVATLGLTAWLVIKVAGCGNPARYPDDAARQRCVEREFPFTRAATDPAAP
ncbi:hypothetical protein [Actinomadura rugatobispora]|uniref:Uncharacterized protein n=1 Tax=Actinomadura rugatobispora TaxID=1994 RepID=A0ABW1A6W9_9ACTN